MDNIAVMSDYFSFFVCYLTEKKRDKIKRQRRIAGSIVTASLKETPPGGGGGEGECHDRRRSRSVIRYSK